MSTDTKITNLRWCLWHLDGINADLIGAALAGSDDEHLAFNLTAFREAVSSVHTAVSLLTQEERARLERATSAGWFDRLRVQIAAMTRWCRNELGSPGNVCLELMRRNASTYRVGHSLDQIDAFRRMDEELAFTFHTTSAVKRDRTGTISEADNRKVQAAINDYRGRYAGADPTIEAIRIHSALGSGKISDIMRKRRELGLWATPPRTPRQK